MKHLELKHNAETKAIEGGSGLTVASSYSDHGLCGGIHSSVSKATRRAVHPSRSVRANISLLFTQIGKAVRTFVEANSTVNVIKAVSGCYFLRAKNSLEFGVHGIKSDILSKLGLLSHCRDVS
ncbi:hypothetical protein CLU79DRAFT_833105 [Phycomyces nitens]|nr:hypothetical protein CLU79DRAFT_833105 [Phycomyces nitens]